MDIKKFAPWNWFKKEDEETGGNVPVVQSTEMQPLYSERRAVHPIAQLHREVDRLFEDAFRGFGMSPFKPEGGASMTLAGLLKPQVDVGATEKEYTITVEVPGVDEKDIKVEIANNTMTVRGEKKQEKEEKDKNYYRVERSYGSFQRVLSLPEDADQEDIKATFKKGVLTIKMPRKDMPKTDVKQIQIT